MERTKFKLKRFYRNEILTYYEGNRPRRVYGNRITDEFAENYLKFGTEEEIKKRKEKFENLPVSHIEGNRIKNGIMKYFLKIISKKTKSLIKKILFEVVKAIINAIVRGGLSKLFNF